MNSDKRKQSSFRLEQRSYTNNTPILLLRNDQIANFLIKFAYMKKIDHMVKN